MASEKEKAIKEVSKIRACSECHKSKNKCVFPPHDPNGPRPTCERCSRLEKECVPHLSRQGKRKQRDRLSMGGASSCCSTEDDSSQHHRQLASSLQSLQGSSTGANNINTIIGNNGNVDGSLNYARITDMVQSINNINNSSISNSNTTNNRLQNNLPRPNSSNNFNLLQNSHLITNSLLAAHQQQQLQQQQQQMHQQQLQQQCPSHAVSTNSIRLILNQMNNNSSNSNRNSGNMLNRDLFNQAVAARGSNLFASMSSMLNCVINQNSNDNDNNNNNNNNISVGNNGTANSNPMIQLQRTGSTPLPIAKPPTPNAQVAMPKPLTSTPAGSVPNALLLLAGKGISGDDMGINNITTNNNGNDNANANNVMNNSSFNSPNYPANAPRASNAINASNIGNSTLNVDNTVSVSRCHSLGFNASAAGMGFPPMTEVGGHTRSISEGHVNNNNGNNNNNINENNFRNSSSIETNNNNSNTTTTATNSNNNNSASFLKKPKKPRLSLNDDESGNLKEYPIISLLQPGTTNNSNNNFNKLGTPSQEPRENQNLSRSSSSNFLNPEETIGNSIARAYAKNAGKQLISLKHHYGLQCQIREWISMALVRRSFGLLGKASSLANRCGIHMDRILCGVAEEGEEETGDGNVRKTDSPGYNSVNIGRRMNYLLATLLEPRVQQSIPLLERRMLVPRLPQDVLAFVGCQSCPTFQEHEMRNRWIIIRQTDRGHSRFYCSPAFERNVICWSHISQIYEDNLADINSLIFVKDDFRRLMACVAHQLSSHSVEGMPSRPVHAPKTTVRLLSRQLGHMNYGASDVVRQAKSSNTMTLEMDLSLVFVPTMDRTIYYMEMFHRSQVGDVCGGVYGQGVDGGQPVALSSSPSNAQVPINVSASGGNHAPMQGGIPPTDSSNPPTFDDIVESEEWVGIDDVLATGDIDDLLAALCD